MKKLGAKKLHKIIQPQLFATGMEKECAVGKRNEVGHLESRGRRGTLAGKSRESWAAKIEREKFKIRWRSASVEQRSAKWRTKSRLSCDFLWSYPLPTRFTGSSWQSFVLFFPFSPITTSAQEKFGYLISSPFWLYPFSIQGIMFDQLD